MATSDPTDATGHSPRRLFVGDLHGCLNELDILLSRFAFRPGRDALFSVGDVVGKGPDVSGTFERLRGLGARAVLGNHELALLDADRNENAGIKPKYRDYLDSLGKHRGEWIAWISSWPLAIDLGDILLVHAGLQPGVSDPAAMTPRILTQIRTWDGKGDNLNRNGDPAWFECVSSGNRTVVFGHWAQRGLIDRPGFKGLDTGCVYGGRLTGWCPEEDRFLQVDAARSYAPIHYH